MKKNLKKKKGFTLIELVVVIAILGILAAIAVPRLLGFQGRARAQADKQSAVQVRNALALLNANREITVAAGGGTFTIPNTGDPSSAGLTAARDYDADSDIDAEDVEAAVIQLTGTIAVQGNQNIVVAIAADGTVTVTNP